MESISQDDGSLLQMIYSSNSLKTIVGGQTHTDFTYSSNKVSVEVQGAWRSDFQLDSQNRIIQRDQYVNYSDDKPIIETTIYQYATAGQLQKIITPNGGIETFSYSSPFGLLTQHVRPNNQQTDYVYDLSKNRPLLQSTTMSLPGSDKPIITYSVYERRTNGSNFFGDESDYLRYEISPQGRVVAYEPSPKGPVQYRRSFLSGIYPSLYTPAAPTFQTMQQWQAAQNPQQIILIEYSYNAQGLEIQKIHYATVDKTGNGVHDSAMSQTDSDRDIFGYWINQEKQLERDDKENVLETAQTNRRFDGLERGTSLIDPLDNMTTTQYVINDDKSVDQGTYAVIVTQPNGRIEKTILDKQGDSIYRVVSIPKGSGYSSPQMTHWNRDSGGRPIVINNPDGSTLYQSYYLNNLTLPHFGGHF